MSPNKITIGITTRNRCRKLRNCLDSLVKQTVKPDEVLIINNGSTDNTNAVINEFYSKLNIKSFTESKIGIPYVRNLILEKATGGIIAFLDDDCLAIKNWVKRILSAHQKYPEAAAIQGKTIFLPRGSIRSRVSEMMYMLWLENNTVNKNKLLVLDTKNVSLKNRAIKRLKIKFDDTFTRGSDVDFGKQLLFKKQQIIYCPKIIVGHDERPNIISALRQKYAQGESEFRYYFKWPRTLFPKNASKFTARKKLISDKYRTDTNSLSSLFYRSLRFLMVKTFILGFNRQKSKLSVKDNIIKRRTKNISVAIVTRNRARLLKNCLMSLVLQSFYPKELLVVDNGSTDNTKEVIKSFEQILPIRYLFEPKKGTGNARNKALENASEPILAFIDDDCEAHFDWLEQIYAAHKINPHVVAIQGKSFDFSTIGIFKHVTSVTYDSWLNANRRKTNELGVLDTKNVSLKVKFLRRNGIKFDSLFTLYSDDVDLAKQIINKGGKILFGAEIRVRSLAKQTLFSYLLASYRKGLANAFINHKWQSVNIYNYKRSPHYYTKLKLKHKWLSVNLLRLSFFFFNIGYFMGRKKIELNNDESLFVPINNGSNKPRGQNEVAEFPMAVLIRSQDNYLCLERCLESLLKQKKKIEKIIVIDSSKKFKPEFYRKLNHHREINVIKTTFFNLDRTTKKCIQEITQDLLVFIEDNTQVSNEWSEETIKAHHLHPKTFAILGKIKCLPSNSLFSLIEQTLLDKWLILNLRKTNILNNFYLNNLSIKQEFLNVSQINIVNGSLLYFLKSRFRSEKLASTEGRFLYVPKVLAYKFQKSSLFLPLVYFFRKGEQQEFRKLRRYDNKEAVLSFDFNLSTFVLLLSRLKKKNPILFSLPLIFLYLISSAAFRLGAMVMKKRNNEAMINPQIYEFRKSKPRIDNLAIAIVTRNRAEYLSRALFSLFNQAIHPNRVIVVDNGSTDNTKEIVNAYQEKFPIKYVYESRIGVACARNKALKMAKEDYLAFLDDDCVAEKDWTLQIFAAVQKNPNLGAIQGKALSTGESPAISNVAQFYWDSWLRESMVRNYAPADQVRNKLAEPEGVFINALDTKNACLNLRFIRNNDLLFDESLTRGEDVDMASKIILNKNRILYCKDALVHHAERSNLIGMLSQNWQRGKATYLIRKKRAAYNIVKNKNSIMNLSFQFIDFCYHSGKLKELPYFYLLYLFNYQIRVIGNYFEKIANNRLTLKYSLSIK